MPPGGLLPGPTSLPELPAAALLARAEHRPLPLPRGPWVMRQSWHDLCFAHWPVPAEALRPLVPDALELDRFEERTWLGIVPFRMSRVRLRGLPAVPGVGAFPELNVRTYVRHGEHRGVWFFSLDAASALAVRVARAWFGLPYFDARMGLVEERGREGTGIRYRSTRTHRGAPAAELAMRYGPEAEVERASPGSLEHFLTERYCLFALGRRGVLLRGDIHHAPWPLQRAGAEIETNTMAAAAGLTLPATPPRLHFARRLDVLLWAPGRASSG